MTSRTEIISLFNIGTARLDSSPSLQNLIV